MSNYNLNLTGAQIDAALNKVHNADTTPIDGSTNVVTSDGVHEAVNNIQFANLNNNLVSTDLSSGNNNTTIPTTQAVSNLVGDGIKIAFFTAPDDTSNSDTSTNVDVPIDLVETANPYSIASVSNGEITLGAGLYHITFFGEYREDSSLANRFVTVEYQIDGVNIPSGTKKLDETGNDYEVFYRDVVHQSDSSFVVRIRKNFTNYTYLNHKGVRVTIVKFP